MTTRNENVQDIRLDLIDASENRARFLLHARVMQLADDIEVNGLVHPVLLRPMADGTRYALVYGGHRLAAFEVLERETIPAFVREMTDEEARLEEVRENLLGPNLTVLDRALHLKIEKQIYEARNPLTKHGGDRRSDQVANVGHLKNEPRFTAEMAETLGCGERSVRRAIAIAEIITPELHAEIHGTALADNQKQLEALAKEPPSDRLQIVRLMKEKNKVKVADAARVLHRPTETPVQLAPEEIWQRKMLALWATAQAEGWKDRFLAAVGAQRRTGKAETK